MNMLTLFARTLLFQPHGAGMDSSVILSSIHCQPEITNFHLCESHNMLIKYGKGRLLLTCETLLLAIKRYPLLRLL